jgi:hypothetical protein
MPPSTRLVSNEKRREMRTKMGEAKATPEPNDGDWLGEVLPGQKLPRRDLFDAETLRKIRLTPENDSCEVRIGDANWKKYRRSSWLWPTFRDADSAIPAAKLGAAVALVVGIFNLVIAGLSAAGVQLVVGLKVDPTGVFLSSAFYLMIAWGIYEMSRCAAVLGLLLYLFDRVALLIQVRPRTRTGFIVSCLCILAFVHAVRGTFAYRKFTCGRTFQ